MRSVHCHTLTALTVKAVTHKAFHASALVTAWLVDALCVGTADVSSATALVDVCAKIRSYMSDHRLVTYCMLTYPHKRNESSHSGSVRHRLAQSLDRIRTGNCCLPQCRCFAGHTALRSKDCSLSANENSESSQWWLAPLTRQIRNLRVGSISNNLVVRVVDDVVL